MDEQFDEQLDEQMEHTDEEVEEVKEMNEALNIIFKYQENMSDGDYLKLNSLIHNSMKVNQELSSENNILNEKNRYLEDDNNRLVNHNAELYKIIKEFKETLSIQSNEINNISNESKETLSIPNNEINNISNEPTITFTYDDDDEKDCHCQSRWCFSDTSERKITDYESFFCLDNLKDCENFKELCKHCPLMNNLFGKSDEKFFEDFSEDNSNLKYDYIVMILRILITLVGKTSVTYNKAIIVLVFHDFIIKNLNFLVDIKYKSLANMVKKKFEEFYNDTAIFIPIAESYNINIDKWYKIIQDLKLE